MRITYRTRGVKDYWEFRWSDISADEAMTNVNAYPLKYALRTVTSNDGAILEAGCGAGRILRYFQLLVYFETHYKLNISHFDLSPFSKTLYSSF